MSDRIIEMTLNQNGEMVLRRELETARDLIRYQIYLDGLFIREAEKAAVAWRWLATFETHDMGTHLKLVMSEQKHEQR